MTEREYEGLKDRVCGMRIEFKRVTCINATVPLSASLMSAHELCSSCKVLIYYYLNCTINIISDRCSIFLDVWFYARVEIVASMASNVIASASKQPC